MKIGSQPRPIRTYALLLCMVAVICICTVLVDAWPPNTQRPVMQAHVTSFPFADSGTLVEVPESASVRLGLEQIETVQQVAPRTQQRIESSMASMLPCWQRYVENVLIIRHPERADVPKRGARDHFMAAMVTVDAYDPITRRAYLEPVLNLYLYLPDDLLDGSGLDTPQTSTNIVPYAAAPIPQTLGDILDWTLYHEVWHLLDLHARLDQLVAHPSGLQIEHVVNDPAAWRIAFPELTVGQKWGWIHTGERYLMSDELEGDRTIRAGATSYQFHLGSILASYDDGEYAFRRPFQRSDYVPPELINLSNLAPLLHGGRIPTLYALFNTSDERLAEYGAWFVFARYEGDGRGFETLFPELNHAYDLRLQEARRQCPPGSKTG